MQVVINKISKKKKSTTLKIKEKMSRDWIKEWELYIRDERKKSRDWIKQWELYIKDVRIKVREWVNEK